MTLPSGTRIGPYEIGSPIGAGGMGEVYRARDTKLGREVAIKVLPGEFSRHPERVERFEREARLLAQLNHPNIATIHGLEHDGVRQCLVMELVEGETLAEHLARGPLPFDEALPLFIAIAEGLEAAHEKGIIHRDLKPANVKIGPNGKPKILDFGLAKAFAPGEDVSAETSQSPTLTRGTALGAILGTAAYMSPEQARGKPVDTRTDVWAFGCCLYEALTATKVFSGESVTDVLAAVVKNEPDWDLLPARTPFRARDVLRRCLQKDKRLRFHHMADARLELQDSAQAPEVPAVERQGKSRRGAFVMTALIASFVTAAAFLALRSRPPDEPRPVTQAVLPLEREYALALTPSLAISPDGRSVAYVVVEGRGEPGPEALMPGTSRLYIRALHQAQGRPVDDTEGARAPFFSPDGQWLGFQANRILMKVSVSGGAPTRIAEIGTGEFRGAHWGPAGQIFFSTGPGSGLWSVSADGGTPEPVTTPSAERREKSHRNPEALPGGRAVLFTLGSADIASWDDASIAVLSLDSGEYKVLVEGGMNPHYSETGHLVYARAGSLLAVPFDVGRLEVTGAPVTVLEGVATSPFGGNAEVSISRNGHLLYASGGPRLAMRDMQWVDRDGGASTLFTKQAQDPRVSPDGRRLALWVVAGNDTVGVYDLEREILSELARGFDNRTPVWSPEGDRVAFSSNRAGSFNLYVTAADGSTPPQRLTTGDFSQYPGSWSPDGRWIAFDEERPGRGRDLLVLSLESETVEPFVESSADESDPQFSPDGEWIAYVSDETGEPEVHVRAFGGSGQVWRASSGGGAMPRWNPDGSELFYRSGDRMMVMDLNPMSDRLLGRPRVLLEDLRFSSFDVSPDGRHFAVTKLPPPVEEPIQLNLVLNWGEELKRLVP